MAGFRKAVLVAWLLFAFIIVVMSLSRVTSAQQAKPANTPAKPAAKPAGNVTGNVARGKYIVEDVAWCQNCHTPRLATGEFDRTKWLQGGSLFMQPPHPMPDWPIVAPRIGGNPPATDEQMVTLLTQGIWTDGKPLRQPMPQFHMNREDAEAVVAYLKSLKAQ